MTSVEMIDVSKEIDDIEQHLLKLNDKMNTKSKTNDTLEQLFEVNTIIIKLCVNLMREVKLDKTPFILNVIDCYEKAIDDRLNKINKEVDEVLNGDEINRV